MMKFIALDETAGPHFFDPGTGKSAQSFVSVIFTKCFSFCDDTSMMDSSPYLECKLVSS